MWRFSKFIEFQLKSCYCLGWRILAGRASVAVTGMGAEIEAAVQVAVRLGVWGVGEQYRVSRTKIVGGIQLWHHWELHCVVQSFYNELVQKFPWILSIVSAYNVFLYIIWSSVIWYNISSCFCKIRHHKCLQAVSERVVWLSYFFPCTPVSAIFASRQWDDYLCFFLF